MGMEGSAGRATYSKTMQLWDEASGKFADFTTNFSFIIDSQLNFPYADGIAFFLAPDGFAISNAQGGGHGLVSGDQIYYSTSNPFVAVEFDSFQNDWDQPDNNVGFNINSMVSVSNVTWWNGILDGKSNDALIGYNSSSKNLCVVFTGFDAATGLNFEIHTICACYFSSNLQIDNITSPGPGAVEVSPSPDHSRPNKRGLAVGLVMPLPTHIAPPVNMSAFSISASSYGATGSEGGQNQSSSSDYNTNSSKLTASSSASSSSALLLYSLYLMHSSLI
ncbi:hypothetical protein F0562_028846 [Nyssa sinensis]|uniref:Legume lectin domain-containing protein n=1 Tax=Nyssa sinensis TaxID=561372 RepID=A0A5J5B1B0_9ASTE|nr:hypothetical protein F0562_028846 [Nyssa sinensis]